MVSITSSLMCAVPASDATIFCTIPREGARAGFVRRRLPQHVARRGQRARFADCRCGVRIAAGGRGRARFFSQLCLLSLLAAFPLPFGFALLFVLRHAASPCAASNYCKMLQGLNQQSRYTAAMALTRRSDSVAMLSMIQSNWHSAAAACLHVLRRFLVSYRPLAALGLPITAFGTARLSELLAGIVFLQKYWTSRCCCEIAQKP